MNNWQTGGVFEFAALIKGGIEVIYELDVDGFCGLSG